MGFDQISDFFEKSREKLKKEHDSMIAQIKEEISSIKRKALSKITVINISSFSAQLNFRD